MKKEFKIISGADSEMEFKGFTAQYIAIAAFGLLGCLLLFTFLYLMGCPMLFNALISGILYGIWHFRVYSLNKEYGRHGLMKKKTFQRIPDVIKIRDRNFVSNLRSNKRTNHDK